MRRWTRFVMPVMVEVHCDDDEVLRVVTLPEETRVKSPCVWIVIPKGSLAAMDAIALLRADHQAVNQLFVKFEAAGARALKTKRNLVDKVITELAVHAVVEEQVFYPAVRQAAPDLDLEILEGIEEHHIVRWSLSELEGLSPDEENFGAKVSVLIENVRRHVMEEEKVIFPQARKAFTRQELEDLGNRLATAKKVAPTHPHPRSPSTPPSNLVAGAIAGLADKARDAAAATLGR
jgi:hemerythrin-like domain-containing protein